MLETAEIKRCAVCLVIWEASAIVREDGLERCPRHRLGDRSEERKAEILAAEQQYIAECVERESLPQISDAPFTDPILGSIRKMTDADGRRVYAGAPLSMVRGVAKTLLLLGRDFSASDVITGHADMTVAVSSRTATLTTLSLTAGVSMTPGDGYGLVFNDVHYRGLFSVR